MADPRPTRGLAAAEADLQRRTAPGAAAGARRGTNPEEVVAARRGTNLEAAGEGSPARPPTHGARAAHRATNQVAAVAAHRATNQVAAVAARRETNQVAAVAAHRATNQVAAVAAHRQTSPAAAAVAHRETEPAEQAAETPRATLPGREAAARCSAKAAEVAEVAPSWRAGAAAARIGAHRAVGPRTEGAEEEAHLAEREYRRSQAGFSGGRCSARSRASWQDPRRRPNRSPWYSLVGHSPTGRSKRRVPRNVGELGAKPRSR
ncbi:MAG: hypothetical protein GX607_08700 [Myxococcales bacterium]|nr:hypothetical protein [Myxococcales bacterium]